MAYFDYSAPVLPDMGEGISKVGDALTAVIDRKRKEREFAAQQALAREVEDRKWNQQENQFRIQNAQNARLENRDAETFEMERSKYREDARRRVQAAIAAGNPQEAEAIASSTYVGRGPDGKPQYGSARPVPGGMRDVGPEPKAPQKPVPQAVPPEIAAMRRPQVQPTEMVGPVPDEKTAMSAAVGRTFGQPDAPAQVREAMAARGRQEADVRRYDREFAGSREQANRDLLEFPAKQAADVEAQREFESSTAAFPGEHNRWLADSRLAKLETPYEVNLGGQPFRADVQTARYSGRQADADDFRNSVRPQTPEQQQIAAVIRGEILAGFPLKEAIVAYNKEISGIRSDELARWKQTTDDASQEKIARINATRPAISIGAQDRRADERANKDRRGETRKDIAAWLKANGLEEAPKQAAGYDQTLRQLKGNGKEQLAAITGLAILTQGGDKRFSDADRKAYVDKGGVGLLDEVANTAQKMVDGQYGAEAIAVAQRMARGLKAVYEQRLRDASAAAKDEFVHNEIYDPAVAESVLEQRLGRGYYIRDSDRGEGRAGAPGAATSGGGGGGSSVNLRGGPDDTVQGLLDEATKRGLPKKRRVLP